MKKTVKRAAGKKAAVRSQPARAKSRPRAKVEASAKAKAVPKAQAAPPAPAVADVTGPVAAPVAAVAAAPASDAFYLTLDASCTLRETADLQFSLVAANGDPLVVDGSGVERVDTAGLQLLVALARRQQRDGRRLEWKAVSTELRKCSERLGLIDALGLAPAAGETP